MTDFQMDVIHAHKTDIEVIYMLFYHSLILVGYLQLVALSVSKRNKRYSYLPKKKSIITVNAERPGGPTELKHF